MKKNEKNLKISSIYKKMYIISFSIIINDDYTRLNDK